MKGRESAGSGERGYSLVVLMISITIMLVLLAAATPSWRYVVKNDREEELIFRGGEIADAIARYQRKNGNALPVSLEVLVKGKFLRREYKDPMAKDGKWRFIRPGEALGQARSPFAKDAGPGATTTTTTTTRPSMFAQSSTVMGGFQGVASTSTDMGLRLFNGREKYNEWVFMPGQPRVVGKPIGPPLGLGGPMGARGLPRGGGAGPLNPQAVPYVVPP
jgi:type II secretory pathway pseudopilin PulG